MSTTTLEPGTITTRDTSEENSLDTSWCVLVWDDPVNTIQYVTYVFQTVLELPKEEAEVLTMKIHNESRTAVWSGLREQCEVRAERLLSYQLQATIAKI